MLGHCIEMYIGDTDAYIGRIRLACTVVRQDFWIHWVILFGWPFTEGRIKSLAFSLWHFIHQIGLDGCVCCVLIDVTCLRVGTDINDKLRGSLNTPALMKMLNTSEPGDLATPRMEDTSVMSLETPLSDQDKMMLETPLRTSLTLECDMYESDVMLETLSDTSTWSHPATRRNCHSKRFSKININEATDSVSDTCSRSRGALCTCSCALYRWISKNLGKKIIFVSHFRKRSPYSIYRRSISHKVKSFKPLFLKLFTSDILMRKPQKITMLCKVLWNNIGRSPCNTLIHHLTPRWCCSCRAALEPEISEELAGLWGNRTVLMLGGSKSLLQMKGKFAFHLEIKPPDFWRKSGEALNPRCLCGGSTVMSWAAMSSAGVGPRCPLKSTVIYQERLEHIVLSLADNLYGDADFISQPCRRYLNLVELPWCYCVWLAGKTRLIRTP